MLKFFNREKFIILLTMLLLNVIAAPFFSNTGYFELVLDITFTGVMLSAIFSLSKSGTVSLVASVTLMLPCLFFIWLGYFYTPKENVILASSVLQAFFILYIALMIILSIFKAPKVTRDVIAAAVVVYLFASLLFAKLYMILELVYPGSFSMDHNLIVESPGVLKYFSIVTLSTLGYGDIVPMSSPARSLVSVEAIFGQIYLAVLVARLVSMHGSASSGKKG
ncbi:MAG: Ion channel protein [Desulfobacter sp.]|nr:Ion channel protein [Desulfobacter sp.]